MPQRTFEQWIDGIFDHAVAEPAWYWDPDADTCVEADDETNATYLARLFTESASALQRFDNAQVNQGLNMIAHGGVCSNHAFSITQARASWPTRRRAIRAIYDLYANCFAARCDQTLCHLPNNLISNPLNYICYMWWDVFPAWDSDENPTPVEEVKEYIAVLERCVAIPHLACIEGALHGLGHWQLIHPERVEPIVDRFLEKNASLRPELLKYAARARDGNVQ